MSDGSLSVLNWSLTKATYSLSLTAFFSESVYISLSIFRGNDALPLFVTGLKCFQIVLVSFCEAINSEKCFFFALRMRCRVLFRYNLYCVQFWHV